MRKLMTPSASALMALLIGSGALSVLPALAAPALTARASIQMAQAEPERRGGGERGARGDRRDRGPRMERAPRGDVAPRQERILRSSIERIPRSSIERTPRSSIERGPRVERDRTITRRDAVPNRRYSRDRRYDDRRYRVRPGYRSDFVFLGGPRVIVRGYGPNWCRGLHRGNHWAPGIGWHAGTHRGLFRCY